ncbi:MAG: cysteine desulfurase family protein [Nanoarchaeota archaeon]
MQAYLDSASTTAVTKSVVESMLPFFNEKFGNPSSMHRLGEVAADALERSREVVAKKINANADQIIFTSCGSEGNNFIIKQVPRNKKLLMSAVEHKSLLDPGKECNYKLLPVDKECFVKEYEPQLGTGLISVIHVNNEVGAIQDIKYWNDVARDCKALFHTDIVQSFCKLDFNVKKIPVDFLTISAHKIHGPKGVGAVFVNDPTKAKSLIAGSQEFGLRAGTQNVPGIAGFAKAIQNYSPISSKVLKEFERFRALGVVNTPKKSVHGLLNISFGVLSMDMLQHLSHKKVFVSSGSACSAREQKPSHVLLAMNLPEERIKSALRLSISQLTSVQELKYAYSVFEKVLYSLKKIS